jgi:hypothetical protein
MGWIYIYEENGFAPDNVNMFGYTIGRETPTEVDAETDAKLSRHPHFKRVMGDSHNDIGVAHTDAADTIPSEGGKELSSKEKKAAYMRDYMSRKRASK